MSLKTEWIDRIDCCQALKKYLEAQRISQSASKAEWIFESLAGRDRLESVHSKVILNPKSRRELRRVVLGLCEGKPLQYLLGHSYFLGRKFLVEKGVLIPRPETERLFEIALECIQKSLGEKPKILDLGTGSGILAISLTLEGPDCRMTGLDLSPKALEVARKNGRTHGVNQKIFWLKSDLFKKFKKGIDLFDLIVSNPPYLDVHRMALPKEVRHEPKMALHGGPGGWRVIERIVLGCRDFLSPGGYLLMEIDPKQPPMIRRMVAKSAGLKLLRIEKDLVGKSRVAVIQKEAHG